MSCCFWYRKLYIFLFFSSVPSEVALACPWALGSASMSWMLKVALLICMLCSACHKTACNVDVQQHKRPWQRVQRGAEGFPRQLPQAMACVSTLTEIRCCLALPLLLGLPHQVIITLAMLP